MMMSRPIVTPDLDFARDICGPAALYYDPLSAGGAADALTAFVNDPILRADPTVWPFDHVVVNAESSDVISPR